MLSAGTKKRRSISYPKEKSEHVEPSAKYRRITEKNSLSAKLIDNEKRLKIKGPTPSAEICARLGLDNTAPDPNAANEPWNFLSCCCLNSPRQVWYNLCKSDSELYRIKPEIYRKKHWWHSDRSNVLVHMMKLCQKLKFRRETYHHAVDIFDRFMILSDRSFPTKEDVNFIGLFIVHIAMKIEEDFDEWHNIANYMCEFVTRGYLRRINKPKLELEILETLQWSLRAITAFDWSKIFMHMMRTHSIYKRVENLSLAQQSTPVKKRTKIRSGISDDEEVDLLTWGQLDNLVIGEPRKYEDWVNQVPIAQVLDLCTADLYSFNFTYRELGAAASIWFLGIDDKLATKITGLKIKSLHRALEFVRSYGCIYNRIISCSGTFVLAYDPDVFPIHDSEDSKTLEKTKTPKRKKKKAKSPTKTKSSKNVQTKSEEANADMPKCWRFLEIHGAFTSLMMQEEPLSPTSEAKLRKRSNIMISDTEVSLLELDVNSPDFLRICVYANIPKQKRLSILSPRKYKKQFGVIIFQQDKTASSGMEYSETVSDTCARPSLQSTESISAQVQETQSELAETNSAEKAAEGVMSVELECDCGNPGCNKLQTVQVGNKKELEALRYELSIQKYGEESEGSMVVEYLPLEPQTEDHEGNPRKRKTEEERDKDSKEEPREKCDEVVRGMKTEKGRDEVPQKRGRDEQSYDPKKGNLEGRHGKVQKMEKKEKHDINPRKRKADRKRSRGPKKGKVKRRRNRKKIPKKMEKEEKSDEDPQKTGIEDDSDEDRKKEELKGRRVKVLLKKKKEEGHDPQKRETEKRGGDSQKGETKKGRKKDPQKKRTKEECNSDSEQREEGKSSEASPLHPIEMEDLRMHAYLIQTPPLSSPVMKRIFDRLSSFWHACEIRKPTRRRYSYPMRWVIAKTNELKRIKSADFV